MSNLPFIHYSDPKFQNGKEHIIYGTNSNDLNWTYSDRLFDWTYKNRKEDGESDIQYWERILKLVIKKEVKIQCVLGGCNPSNGFEYYVLGYKNE